VLNTGLTRGLMPKSAADMNNKQKRAKFRSWQARPDPHWPPARRGARAAVPAADQRLPAKKIGPPGATMISLAQIEEFTRTRPFRRFYIETAGGNYITIESERHIALPPAGHNIIIVYGNDGLVHHLAKDAIINAAVFGPVPHKTNET
jgi:hypothetical protein